MGGHWRCIGGLEEDRRRVGGGWEKDWRWTGGGLEEDMCGYVGMDVDVRGWMWI